VPELQTLSYCNDTLDTSTLNDLAHDLKKIGQIGIGLLVLLAVVFVVFSLYQAWFGWRSLQKHVTSTREAYLLSSDTEEAQRGMLDNRSLLSLLQLSTHPLLAEWGLKAAERAGIRSADGKTRVRWWLAWISHPVSITLLIMGVLGLLSTEIQIAAVKGVEHHYQGRFDNMLDNSVYGLEDKINSHLKNASYDFANKSNLIILQAQDDLNTDLFQWVNVTTSTMNNTLNEFMDGIATAINDTFANTPLYSSIGTFIDCIIGQKVAGIESALTWIQSNAHATFPTLPPDILMVSNDTLQTVIRPMQDTVSSSDGILSNVVGTYLRALEKEKIMFLLLLLLYCLLFLVGSFIAVMSSERMSHPSDARSTSEEKHLDDACLPVQDTTSYYQSTLPATRASHRSISKPLHPDVVSLYHQRHPSIASNAFPRPHSRTSWESLLDEDKTNVRHSFLASDGTEEIQLHRHTLSSTGQAF
jgi:hypothetical protein